MKNLKEMCELIEKNQATEIGIRAHFNEVGIWMDCRSYNVFSSEEFKILKEKLMLNSSLKKVTIGSFSDEKEFSEIFEGLHIQGMSELAFLECRFNLKEFITLLGKNTLIKFEYSNHRKDFTPPRSEVFDYISKFSSSSLKALILIDGLSKDNIQSVSKMIANCKALTSLDLSCNNPEFYKEVLPVIPQTVNELSVSIRRFLEDRNLSADTVDSNLISDSLIKNTSIRKLTVIKMGAKKPPFEIDESVSLLKIPNITSLAFMCPMREEQSMKLFLEALSKSKNLMELHINERTRYRDKIYDQCAIAQVLIGKRVAKDVVKKVLNFLVNDKQTNELAYNAYVNRKLLKFSPGPAKASSTEIKKEREEIKETKETKKRTNG